MRKSKFEVKTCFIYLEEARLRRENTPDSNAFAAEALSSGLPVMQNGCRSSANVLQLPVLTRVMQNSHGLKVTSLHVLASPIIPYTSYSSF